MSAAGRSIATNDLGLAAFEASPNPYVILAPDFTIVGMNQAYLDVTGRTRKELAGRDLFDAFAPGPDTGDQENARQLRASLERVIETGEPDHLAVIRYAIPVVGPTGEMVQAERFWSATHTPIFDDQRRLSHILQHANDITELERLRRERGGKRGGDPALGGDILARAEAVQRSNQRLDSERRRLIELFTQAPGFMAILSGPDLVFDMANDAYHQLVGGRQVVGKPLGEALPEVVAQGFIDAMHGVIRSGQPVEGREARVALRRRPEGPMDEVFVDFIYQPIRDASGEVTAVFVQGHDVTAAVVAREQQKLLIDELNHRVKNTLATVQSIAMQTARSHAEPVAFARAFQARLMALAHTHDLLTRSHWEGAELRDILAHETDAHGEMRVLLNGPRVSLSPSASLSLGMIFHELATNAAKYGALSAAEGRVLVDWAMDEASRLTVEWREIDGPRIETPQHQGFGTRLIERSARHDLAGEAELGYPETGAWARIIIPLRQDGSGTDD